MIGNKILKDELTYIRETVYDNCSLEITNLKIEEEGKEYRACKFELNGLNIISRKAKITPKKVGQFVTFWKRNEDGITEPYDEKDQIDFYVINVQKKNRFGQFVLPKSVLIDKKIISTEKKDGKRGFRVYPSWDITTNKQAEKTQKWQIKYFVEFDDKLDLKFVLDLYERR